MNMLEELCGKIAPGLCRLSMSGGIAVKTRAGYRTYDPDTKRLTNCDNFVLDMGEDYFFVIPVKRVKPGDIILANGTPRCVIEVLENAITALNFEDATVETLLPERHLFLGDTYLYGKIISIFGSNGVEGRKGSKRMMKFMMLSGMLRGRDRENGSFSSMLALMMMNGKGGFMDDLFEDEDDDAAKEA